MPRRTQEQPSFLRPARCVSPPQHSSSYVHPSARRELEVVLYRCMHSSDLPMHEAHMKQSEHAKAYPRTAELSATCPLRLPTAALLQLCPPISSQGVGGGSVSLHAQF